MPKLKRLMIAAVLVIVFGVIVAYHGFQMLKDGTQAYMYGYSLVLMDTTRQVMTDPDGGRAPVNHFSHVRKFPEHRFREVVRPNCDTLYSTVWFDLSTEPMVLSLPDSFWCRQNTAGGCFLVVDYV